MYGPGCSGATTMVVIPCMFKQPFYFGAHDPRPSVVPGFQVLAMIAACLDFGLLPLEG